MLFEIFIIIFMGMLVGTLTGLIPGIHINLVALLLFIYSPFFLRYTTPIILAVFIVAMTITHTFLDFLPGIFLGAPEESTALSVLPGHSLLLEGKGYEAISLTTIGAYLGTILLVPFTFIGIFLIPRVYDLISSFIPHILILSIAFLISKEIKGQKIASFAFFLTAGIMGALSLNFYTVKEPLFPLLTGLFGTSMILGSIVKKTSVPEQYVNKPNFDKKELWSAAKSSLISGPLCSFLPGLGASQAAVIGSSLSKEITRRSFLILTGILGTLVAGLNFVALYAIDKPRSGVAVIVGKLVTLNINSLAILISTMLFVGSVSVFLSLFFAKIFAENVSRINYQKLSFAILAMLILLSWIISGPYSVIVLATATSLGILASEYGVKKMYLMGSLILPTILYFLL